jgi:hypothetical protein
MSSFVDSTLLRFAQDAFATGLLRDGIGATALFNAMFEGVDVGLRSVVVGTVSARSYKVPVFESVRMSGTEERIAPDMQRVRKERIMPRHGRLGWVDVAFDATLEARVQALVAPLRTVTSQSLESRLGDVHTLDQLRAALLALYPPGVVDAVFRQLRIGTFDDFARQRHLFVQLVGAQPPDFDPEDPATARSFDLPVRVLIADGFDVAGALQAAKLCRSILDYETVSAAGGEVEQKTTHAFITLFADGAVTDASLPGLTAAQAKAAVQDLFAAERMFALFIA